MSKAEEKGYVAYPVSFYEGTTVDVNEMPRDVFVEGYHQAEKDNELTWQDIELIVNIDKDTDNEESIIGVRNNEEHYKEVLKRFNKMKNEDN